MHGWHGVGVVAAQAVVQALRVGYLQATCCRVASLQQEVSMLERLVVRGLVQCAEVWRVGEAEAKGKLVKAC